MFWKSSYKNKVGLAQTKLKELEQLFGVTSGLNRDLPKRLLKYTLDGDEDGVLGVLAAIDFAPVTLGLHCTKRFASAEKSISWTPFLSRIEPSDAEFTLRLAKVFEAAATRVAQGRFFCDLYFGGARWLEILLQEATGKTVNVWTANDRAIAITGLMIEEMLKADGRDPTVFVTAPFAALKDPESQQMREMVRRVGGLGELYVRHRELVARYLREGGAKERLQAFEIVGHAKTPAETFMEEVVDAATDSSKLLREAAEGMLRSALLAARPQLEHVAREGSRTQREHAVRALAQHYGPQAREFLQSLSETEKSESILKAIQIALGNAETAQAATAFELTPPPREPVVLNAPLSAEARELIAKLCDEYNTFLAEEKVRLAQPNARPLYYLSNELKPLTSDEPKRICRFLEQGGELRAHLAKSLGQYRELFGEPTKTYKLILEHPTLQLIHFVRLYAILGFITPPGGRADGIAAYAYAGLNAYRAAHEPQFTLVDLAEAIGSTGVTEDVIVSSMLQGYWRLFDWEPEAVWPYMLNHLDAIERAFQPSTGDYMSQYRARHEFDNALYVLTKFPSVPPRLVGRLWEMAIGSNKVDRLRAQTIVEKLPDVAERLAEALTRSNYQNRLMAAEWMGRRGDRSAAPLLHAAAKKEKQDAALDEIFSALEKLGEPIETYLDRDRLAADAAKGLKKGIPSGLDWFPWSGLPTLHWQDTGEMIPKDVVTWLIVQSYKLKTPEAGPSLRRYARLIRPSEREELGQLVLHAWLDQDLKHKYSDTEARALAKQQASQTWQSIQQSLQWYANNNQVPPASFQQTQQELEEEAFRNLQRECGTAIADKGVLAIAGACCGAAAVAPVQKYLKEWYGYRAAQCKALIAMLSTVDSQAAIQFLLSIANRFRTKGIREEAEKYVRVLADRKGWTLDELADRTMPTAGFEDDGTLALPFGSREFTLRVNSQLEAVLYDAESKVLKSLPAPRQDDDEEQAKAAKKSMSAVKAELKRFASQQATRLHEAMCTQRTWNADDWRRYLFDHPLARFLCQRLVWSAFDGDKVTRTFRPLDDGTFTDNDDNEITIAEEDQVRLSHRCHIPADVAARWTKHLADYDVAPLFIQFGREPYELPESKQRETSFQDFKGHMLEAFKLRGTATKLGYSRGATQDGGWFYDYIKFFPGLELNVYLNFSGNGLPEENRTVALTDLTFQKTHAGATAGSFGSPPLPLSKIPPVLLSECFNDLRALAALGTGFDPEWEKKVNS